MNKKGLFLVFSTAIISGFAIFINKYSVSVINPYIFTFLKNALVALILTSLILLIKDWKLLRKLSRKQWGLLLLIGLVGGSVPFLLFFKGLSLTSAAQGSFIHKTMFVYVMIMAVIFLKEKISKEFLIGVLLLLLGSFISLKTLAVSFGRGDLLILVATLFWATENIISKHVLKDLTGRIVAWARMFFGSIFILGYLTLSGQLNLVSNLNFQQISWVIITSIILFAYVMTWYSGLKYIPVSLAAPILLLGSPITTLLSLIAGGKVGLREIMAGGLIIAGLVFVIGFGYIYKQINRIKEKVYVRV